VVGILGPPPPRLLEGRHAHKYFTRAGELYERDDEAGRAFVLRPKRCALRHRLRGADAGFVDFVAWLLTQALLECVAAELIAPEAQVVAVYSGFEAGTVDILYVPEDQTRDWEETDTKKATLVSAPALRLWYMGVNVTRGPLKDVRVRQAIAHAIDVPTLLAQLLAGRGTIAAGVIPPTLEGFDKRRQPYAYDTLAARKLLADAGYTTGIDLELWSSQTAPMPRLAQAIQAYLATVGIRIKLVQRDASSMRAAARAGQTDLVVKDWYADYPDAENFLYPLLHTANRGAGGNVSFFSDTTFDRLVDLSRRESDAAKRAVLYAAADSVGYAQVGMVPLFFYNEVYAVQPWIRGFEVPVIFNGQRWERVVMSGAKN
jgi:peptide/nickel transport system substrate-binding protein/oligopeptide transport system substrate-binding protein